MPHGSTPQASFPDQMMLLAGTLTHLSNFMQTGCPRSVHLARLLLHRMDHQPAFDRDVLDFCRMLEREVSKAHPIPRRA